MILELGDGRELQFPDDMADETARQLKRLILTLEQRAQAAESSTRTLQDEMAAMRKSFASAEVAMRDNSAVVEALAALRATMTVGIKQIVDAQLADTVLVANDYGDATRSRKVPRG